MPWNFAPIVIKSISVFEIRFYGWYGSNNLSNFRGMMLICCLISIYEVLKIFTEMWYAKSVAMLGFANLDMTHSIICGWLFQLRV